ncbi:MAG: citramalate synthase [Thermoguttaceae bacterium]|nr:citramalate synthase [Thermoguttaceae bacterium]
MRRIQIYDTTLRDGAQAEGIIFSLQDKLLIAKRLDDMGFDFIEGGYPASNEKDSAFFTRIADRPLEHSTICAFGMTRRKGLKPEEDPGLASLLNSGASVITLVGKSSSFQVTEVIRASLEENLEMIAETVAFVRERGRRVFFDAEHFFDGWKADPDYAVRAVRTAAEAGAESVHLCDTNGGSMPEEIAAGVRAVSDAVSVPVGIHAHNDCGMAVANSLAAVDAGASIVQGTVNGFGERCGNANLVTIIANLLTKKNGAYDLLLPDSLAGLTRLSQFVDEVLNVKSSPRQPYVGRGAFTHKGGMHVSGISRNTSSYEHIDPQLVGNERHVLVSELSGRSNIAARTEKYKIGDNPELLNKILDVVVRKESEGYSYESAEASFDLLVRKTMGIYFPHFERINYHTDVTSGKNGVLETAATVKLRIGNIIRHEVAEGDGPVNALDAAMRKALTSVYPEIRDMSLIDYKVRVLNSEAATAARVRVVIESKDDDEVWGTVGADENVIEASWLALCDSFEYKLSKTRKENR